MGLLTPDDVLRLGLGQGPNQPGGGGRDPLAAAMGPNAVAAMPPIQGPLSALAGMKPRAGPRIKLKSNPLGGPNARVL
jgi:hypothetical protein